MAEAGSAPDVWDPALDALAASADHHALLFENEHVRVLRTRIPAGETTKLHTHRWPALYLIESWSAFVRRDAEGRVLVDSRTVPALAAPSEPIWSEALPEHTLANVGEDEIRLVSVEVKSRG